MNVKTVFIALLATATLYGVDGKELYEKRCSVCHGDRAQKSSLGVSKVIAGWNSNAITSKLKAYKNENLNQYGFGNMMRNRATQLSEEEMNAIAKYIESLKK